MSDQIPDTDNSDHILAEFDRQMLLKDSLPCHHYVFVHRVMRTFCQSLKSDFFRSMASDPQGILNAMWERTCISCKESGDPYFSFEDISIDLMQLSGYPAVVITMPPPKILNEAYMVAAVLLVPIDKYEAGDLPANQPVAYITLEKGLFDVPFLCGWNGEEHTNYKTVVEIDPIKFTRAVMDVI